MKRGRKVVDLGRERRTRATLARLAELLKSDPELADRTRRALTGDLAAPDLEDTEMANDEQVVVRIPSAMLERIERLARVLAEDPARAAEGNLRPGRSVILRMALVRGLDALEAEHPDKPKKLRRK